MKVPGIAQRILVIVLAIGMLSVSGTMAWATVNEYQQRGFIPCGVVVNGTDLSNMDAEQAAVAIEQAVKEPLTRPIVVKTPVGDRTFDPGKTAVTVNVDAMLQDAFMPRAQSTFAERLACSFGEPVDYEVKPQYEIDRYEVGSWIGGRQKEINRKTREATVTVEGNKPVVTKEITGRVVDRKKALEVVAAAIESESREVTLPVKWYPPKTTVDKLGKLIVVDKSDRTLYLYEKGDKLERKWGVAIGQPRYPTPDGRWKVINKRYLPTWTNPGSGWAKSMPPYISPGYSNPLGLRALDLDASGIRIHGTSNVGSIGSAASHGCIRMANSNVVEIYPLVPVGTPVYVVQ